MKVYVLVEVIATSDFVGDQIIDIYKSREDAEAKASEFCNKYNLPYGFKVIEKNVL